MEEQITVKLDLTKARKWLKGEGEDDHIYEKIAQAEYDYGVAQSSLPTEKDDRDEIRTRQIAREELRQIAREELRWHKAMKCKKLP